MSCLLDKNSSITHRDVQQEIRHRLPMIPDELRMRSEIRISLDGALHRKGDAVQDLGGELEVTLGLRVGLS